MKKDEIFIDWLELTAELIEKYKLDNISVKVEGDFVISKEFTTSYKEYVKINAKSDNNVIIQNEYYDILQK